MTYFDKVQSFTSQKWMFCTLMKTLTFLDCPFNIEIIHKSFNQHATSIFLSSYQILQLSKSNILLQIWRHPDYYIYCSHCKLVIILYTIYSSIPAASCNWWFTKPTLITFNITVKFPSFIEYKIEASTVHTGLPYKISYNLHRLCHTFLLTTHVYSTTLWTWDNIILYCSTFYTTCVW